MTFNKRKKNSRQRGSKTHGWGSMKKHRGAGSRGGRGKAGTGKRGDQKKPNYWKEKYFGMHGIKSKNKNVKIINILTIQSKLENWIKNNKIEKKNDIYIIDLNKLGYDKLLSKGIIKSKLEISVKTCSNKVKEKVEKAGGKVNILPKKQKHQQKQQTEEKEQAKEEKVEKAKQMKKEKEET